MLQQFPQLEGTLSVFFCLFGFFIQIKIALTVGEETASQLRYFLDLNRTQRYLVIFVCLFEYASSNNFFCANFHTTLLLPRRVSLWTLNGFQRNWKIIVILQKWGTEPWPLCHPLSNEPDSCLRKEHMGIFSLPGGSENVQRKAANTKK